MSKEMSVFKRGKTRLELLLEIAMEMYDWSYEDLQAFCDFDEDDMALVSDVIFGNGDWNEVPVR